MTLPTLPHAIFSTFTRHTKPRHKANLAKELKMPTHSPLTPADEYLSSLAMHFSNKSLLSIQAHPPPSERNSIPGTSAIPIPASLSSDSIYIGQTSQRPNITTTLQLTNTIKHFDTSNNLYYTLTDKQIIMQKKLPNNKLKLSNFRLSRNYVSFAPGSHFIVHLFKTKILMKDLYKKIITIFYSDKFLNPPPPHQLFEFQLFTRFCAK